MSDGNGTGLGKGGWPLQPFSGGHFQARRRLDGCPDILHASECLPMTTDFQWWRVNVGYVYERVEVLVYLYSKSMLQAVLNLALRRVQSSADVGRTPAFVLFPFKLPPPELDPAFPPTHDGDINPVSDEISSVLGYFIGVLAIETPSGSRRGYISAQRSLRDVLNQPTTTDHSSANSIIRPRSTLCFRSGHDPPHSFCPSLLIYLRYYLTLFSPKAQRHPD